VSGTMSWLRVRAVARRHRYVLQRSPQRWFDVVVWPVVDAILFGAIGVYFGQRAGGNGAATGAAFLLAGIVLFHVVFQAEVSLATGFMEETWSRNLLNIMVTPVKELEYAAGTVLFGLAKLAIGVSVVSLVALALFAFDITTLGLSLIPLVALLLLVGWAVALIVIGLILRVGQGAEILAWGFIALMMPLSGIFYPVSALPGVLQPLAQALPTTHVFNAAREVVKGRPLPLDELAIAAIGAAVVSALAVWFLTKMLATFRKRGYISRHV
jgi:ABC-2 type transport system permease protein